MTEKICYWDAEAKEQKERDATPDEELEIAQRKEPKPLAVPQSVTMRQARLALLQAGKLSAVDAAIAGMAGVEGDSARIEWEFSGAVLRGQPLVLSIAQVLGMTSEEIDQLFIVASGL